MEKDPDVIKNIWETHSKDISGNTNQYDFDLAPNTEILLDRACYERLLQITNISALHTDEHNTFLFGLELKPNQIYFSIPDKSRDYNSSTEGVVSGDNQMKEVVEMIKKHPYANSLVICNIHTHPYGILKNQDGSPSLQNNFISGADIDMGQTFRKDVKRIANKYGKNADTMSGLIAIDNENGNSMISFVWHADDKHFRFNNVKVVEKQPNGIAKWVPECATVIDIISWPFGTTYSQLTS